MNTSTAIVVAPYLSDLLQLAFAVLAVVAIPLANAVASRIDATFNLKGNATSRASIDGVVQDGIALAQGYADTAVTHVGPIWVRDPKIAAAGNFVLAHAPDELAQLGFTESHVVDLVKAAMQQNPTVAAIAGK